jgi:DNA-binding CsgD family transcriptional regulator
MLLIGFTKRGWNHLHDLRLSPREIDVLKAFLNSESQEDTGRRLFISFRTVKHHMSNIYNKLKLRGVTKIWQYMLLHGLIEVLVIELPTTQVQAVGCPILPIADGNLNLPRS